MVNTRPLATETAAKPVPTEAFQSRLGPREGHFSYQSVSRETPL